MALLRCTKKLIAELKIRPEERPSTSDLSNWHANFLRIDRRKCILFTHDRTLYSFFVPGLTKPDFQNFEEIFRQNLFKSLVSENIYQRQIEFFLEDMRVIEFAKTNNRSVLGSMNDLALQLKTMIYLDGGLWDADVAGINHQLNRIPMGGIDMNYGIDELQRFLARMG